MILMPKRSQVCTVVVPDIKEGKGINTQRQIFDPLAERTLY